MAEENKCQLCVCPCGSPIVYLGFRSIKIKSAKFSSYAIRAHISRFCVITQLLTYLNSLTWISLLSSHPDSLPNPWQCMCHVSTKKEKRGQWENKSNFRYKCFKIITRVHPTFLYWYVLFFQFAAAFFHFSYPYQLPSAT